MTDWRETNRAMWDERVPVHVASEFYDVEGFLGGASPLRPFELEELGSVEGAELVHLQCHFGLDTLGWARRGAHVTGLDFSLPAVEAARDVAARAGLDAEFVHADVYGAAEALGGRSFDVVYTGLGALNWLPDIDGWARVVAGLVRPGGRFYLAEFHPFSGVFADEDLRVAYPYFHTEGLEFEEYDTYADADSIFESGRSVEWIHGIGAVVSALIAAGLHLELLHEHDYTLFGRWPFLERRDGGTYHLPADMPSLPLMYSLLASKP